VTRSAVPPLTWWATLRWAATTPLLPSERPARVVELGCGLGAFGARLSRAYGDYVGVEPDAGSAAVARSRVAPWSGRVVPGIDDLPEASARLVCAFEVLEHLSDDVAELRRWCRLGAPGALVVLSVPAEPQRYGAWDERVGHYRRYTREGVAALLRAAGVEPVTITHYGYPFGYALERARNVVARRAADEVRGVPMARRTESSGRQRQARSAAMGVLRRGVAAPFVAWQRTRPDRGPGIVASGRIPGP
jgi:SAM-dependent methyltransferase